MKIQQYCLISSVLTNNRNTCRLRSCLKWMKRYSNLEMTDMHLMYGLAMCNASKAKRLYSEYFPNRRIPNKKTFQKIHEHLWETACFQRRSSYTGRPINRNCRFEEWVLHHVEKNTEDSTRKIARTENVAHVSEREQQLYPYHFQRVLKLIYNLVFCTWFLQMCEREESFVSTIFFTDEASFTRDGIFNFHNNHNWTFFSWWKTNRHTKYVDFFSTRLHKILEEVPVDIRLRIRFMHDGAPPRFSRVVMEVLLHGLLVVQIWIH